MNEGVILLHARGYIASTECIFSSSLCYLSFTTLSYPPIHTAIPIWYREEDIILQSFLSHSLPAHMKHTWCNSPSELTSIRCSDTTEKELFTHIFLSHYTPCACSIHNSFSTWKTEKKPLIRHSHLCTLLCTQRFSWSSSFIDVSFCCSLCVWENLFSSWYAFSFIFLLRPHREYLHSPKSSPSTLILQLITLITCCSLCMHPHTFTAHSADDCANVIGKRFIATIQESFRVNTLPVSFVPFTARFSPTPLHLYYAVDYLTKPVPPQNAEYINEPP